MTTRLRRLLHFPPATVFACLRERGPAPTNKMSPCIKCETGALEITVTTPTPNPPPLHPACRQLALVRDQLARRCKRMRVTWPVRTTSNRALVRGLYAVVPDTMLTCCMTMHTNSSTKRIHTPAASHTHLSEAHQQTNPTKRQSQSHCQGLTHQTPQGLPN